MEEVVDKVKQLPITKAFYEAKQKGETPIIKVRLNNKGEVTAAYLKTKAVTYYFHNTKGAKIVKDEFGDWIVPFDGWGL